MKGNSITLNNDKYIKNIIIAMDLIQVGVSVTSSWKKYPLRQS